MGQGKIHVIVALALVIPVLVGARSMPTEPSVQYQFTIVHAFGATGDGEAPGGPMAIDSKGNLYGTAGGGEYGNGTVYELSPAGNGQWTETILHSFQANDPTDGYLPNGLVIDGDGNLYGTTTFGGDNDTGQCFDGCGTVFEMSPGADGKWTESIIYNFCSLPGCTDGVESTVPPTLGPDGSLYGIASYVAYELTSTSNGWIYNLLYTFCAVGNNCPGGGVTFQWRHTRRQGKRVWGDRRRRGMQYQLPRLWSRLCPASADERTMGGVRPA
jgi:uncharacterized repeat protein (TIGR03803 family)